MTALSSSNIAKEISERGILSKSRGQTTLIIIVKEKYDEIRNLIKKEDNNLKFFIATEDDKWYYIFVVFHRSVSIESEKGIILIKPFAKYLDNIKLIWKQGKLHEMEKFEEWWQARGEYSLKDVHKIGITQTDNLAVSKVSKMSPNEIKDNLTLKEYERWLRIQRLEKEMHLDKPIENESNVNN